MKNKEIYIAELRASKENLQREKADLESQLGELRELLQTTASEVARVQTSNKVPILCFHTTSTLTAIS